MLGLALRFFDFWSGRNRRASMSPFKNMSLIYFYITEQVGRSRAQRLVLDWQHRATEHHVPLNLDLPGFVLDDQLGAAHLLAVPHARSQAERGDPLGNGGQLLLIASRPLRAAPARADRPHQCPLTGAACPARTG